MKKLATLVLGLGLLTCPVLAAPATGEPIKIGEINLYSKLPSMVQPYRNAAQMAVDEVNANGGINGRPLEIVRRDSKMDPATAVTLAEELVTREKVVMLMTCDASSVTLAVSAWAKQNKIPLINTSSEADSIIWENGHDYVFRTGQGGYMWVSGLLNRAIAQYGDKIKGKRWAVIAPNFEFGQSIVKMTKMLAEERGLKPEWVVEQWPAFDKLEAGATIGAIQQAKPDIIFSLLWSNDLAKFVRDGNKRGLFKDRIVISPPVAAPDHIDMLGKDMPVGWLSVGFPSEDFKEPNFVKFRKAYEERYDESLKFYSLTGYSSIQAVAAALRKTESMTPDKVRDALESVTYQTPLGEQHFRKVDHAASVPFWVGESGLENKKGKLLDWKMENAADHSPSDKWILEQRTKTTEGK